VCCDRNGEALRGSLLTASDVIRCVKDCVTAAVATAPPVAVSAVVLPRQPDMVVGQLPEETPVPAGRPWRPRQCLGLDAECRADNPTPAGDRLRDLLTAQLVPSPLRHLASAYFTWACVDSRVGMFFSARCRPANVPFLSGGNDRIPSVSHEAGDGHTQIATLRPPLCTRCSSPL
jgi:hypothetical protein